MTGKHVVAGTSIFVVVLLMVCVLIAYSLQRGIETSASFSPTVPSTINVPTPVPDSLPAPVVLTGLPLCLPHKNPDSPHTNECALGFRTESGEYHVLDFRNMSVAAPDVSRGEMLTLAGEVTPLAGTSINTFEIYDVSSVFLVASVIEASAQSNETLPLP